MTDFIDDLEELLAACRDALPPSGSPPAVWMQRAGDLAREGLQGGDLREELRAAIPVSKRGPLVRALLTVRQLSGAFVSGDEQPAAEALASVSACLNEATGNGRWLRRRPGDKAQLLSIANRDSFDADLPSATKEAQQKQPLVLIMGDVDHFKKVNDSFGHPVGDEVLVAVANVLESAVEGRGKAYRVGGEEIAVLLPNHSLEEGVAAAERVRSAVEQLTFSVADLRPTISFGVACFPGSAPTGEQLVEAADGALYRAKEAGRNRVEVAGARSTVPVRAAAPHPPDALALALQLAESRKAEERRTQLIALEGPARAKALRGDLFSRIAGKVAALEGQTDFRFQVGRDENGCGIHADRVSIALTWLQPFTNSLEKSTLLIQEFPVRMRNGNQPTIYAMAGKVQPTSETGYTADWQDPSGWCWKGRNGKSVTSEELADDVVQRALKAAARPRDDSDDLLLRSLGR